MAKKRFESNILKGRDGITRRKFLHMAASCAVAAPVLRSPGQDSGPRAGGILFEEIAAKARCRACGAVWRAPDYRFDCPECAAADAEILEGRELFIESFDGERPDPG